MNERRDEQTSEEECLILGNLKFRKDIDLKCVKEEEEEQLLQPLPKDECVICAQQIDPDVGKKKALQGWVRYSLECGHDVFHKVCIKNWLKRKADCPLCKKIIDL